MTYTKDKRTGYWIATYNNYIGMAHCLPDAIEACIELIGKHDSIKLHGRLTTS